MTRSMAYNACGACIKFTGVEDGERDEMCYYNASYCRQCLAATLLASCCSPQVASSSVVHLLPDVDVETCTGS